MTHRTAGLVALGALLLCAPAAEASTIAYYRFEGDVTDSSGNGYHGNPNSLRSHATFTVDDAPGVAGDFAVQLTAEGLLPFGITVPGFSMPDPVGGAPVQLTFEAFINLDAQSFAHGMHSIYSRDGHPTFHLDYVWSTGTLSLAFSPVPDAPVAAPIAIHAGEWHHVAAVYDEAGGSAPSAPARVSLYLDGALLLATDYAGAFGGVPASSSAIGANQGGSADLFFGRIDDLRISGVVLAPEQFLGGPSAVPEPAAAALAALGALSAWGRRAVGSSRRAA